MGDLLDASMAWADQWWDPDAGLLWNMPGSYDEFAPPRSIHLVQASAWYAAGLLFRGADGDEARAVRTIEALLACQYDDAGSEGTEWRGTFSRFLETPRPPADAQMWVHFDPNWRQFIGTVFELLLQPGSPGTALDAALQDRMRAAVALAVGSEPVDRVPPTYSNIALMRAWLEVEHGRGGAEAYAAAVVDAFDEHATFIEYNTPTYYGVDLYALALWRDRSSSALLRSEGARIEAALWRDVARWYHPALRNVCGPWSRSYGMDMTRYASLLGLWMWPAVGAGAVPFPSFTADVGFDHSADAAHGALADVLGPSVPGDVDLSRFSGEHTVEQRISSSPDRVATGWLSERVMCGGESGTLGTSARGQYHPATVHWQLPAEEGVGWIRLVHDAPARAVASPGAMAIECLPSARRGAVAPELWVYAGPSLSSLSSWPAGRSWPLPGLNVEVASAFESVEPSGVDGVWKVRFPVGTSDLSLRLAAA